MATSTALKAAAAIVVFLIVALAAVQGTLAAWHKTAAADAGTVQAAEFTVHLLAKGASNSVPMTVNGAPTTVSLSGSGPLGPLYPGRSSTTAVQMSNGSNASSNFLVQMGVGAPKPAQADDAMFQYLLVEVKKAAAFIECEGDGYTALTSAGFFAEVAQSKSVVFCLRVSLKTNAPDTLQGAKSTLNIPFFATQVG